MLVYLVAIIYKFIQKFIQHNSQRLSASNRRLCDYLLGRTMQSILLRHHIIYCYNYTKLIKININLI